MLFGVPKQDIVKESSDAVIVVITGKTILICLLSPINISPCLDNIV